ncbi:hypothetical protein [Sphingomonas azotifigens]|uniref:hypothetical protein n=1 Tax=Sphingomonas azotifigens TaxID=330920 RepID=UPI0009FD27CB|nr:hypothetical protein [Sphingomonas azotifigens]
MIDSDALADLIAELIGDHVERATAPLVRRIGELEAQCAAQLSADRVKALIVEAVAALPTAHEALTVEDLAPLLSEMVEGAVAALPVPKDGESVDPEVVRAMVNEAVAALPPPLAPEAITVDDLAPLITETVERAVAALPVPKDGESVNPEVVRAMVNEAVAALPPPPAPEAITVDDLAPLITETVERAVAALPVPKDGESVDPGVVRAMVTEAVAALPPPADGIGLADALIDRFGELVLTMTDGSIRKLGQVVGSDADMPALERQLREMVEAIPKPKDAFELEDLSVESDDGGRIIRLCFCAGGVSKSFDLSIPVTIYRGVWREGDYKAGDAVTWAGSLWIADADTAAKPETDTSWKLAVKRGRDARPAKA